MSDDLKLSYGIDLRAFERQLTAIQKQALPAAQSGYLNALAFGARKSLLSAFEKEIAGGPVAFTKRGVVVDKSSPAASSKLESVVKLLPEQARYLQYPILGGARRAGDPGASRYDVLTEGRERNAYGNIRKGYLSRIAKKAKAEKNRRKSLRLKREELQSNGKPTARYKWSSGTRAPGVFFGEIRGAKGYWQRPSTPSDKLELLARFSERATYRTTVHWSRAIEKAVFIEDPKSVFNAELRRAIAKLAK